MTLYDKVMELSKRRGFLWPSFEIYGGTSGFVTYGPYGAILKRNIENMWREFFIHKQDNFIEIETPIIMPSAVFEASGHLEHFTDPIIACLKCEKRYRADHLIEELTGVNVEGLSIRELSEIVKEKDLKCPDCKGPLSEVELFNLMFKTNIGAYKGDIGYARPEAAQGMFVEFKRVFNIMRERIPLGIAQIGKTLRNEISPRKGVTRLREFTIMEVEVILDPDEINNCPGFEKNKDVDIPLLTASLQQKGEPPITITVERAFEEGLIDNKWLAYFLTVSKSFVKTLGVAEEKIRFREQLPHEKAHYSKQTIDLQVYLDGQGWTEIAGHAYRTDWDLSRHIKYSGVDMRVFKKADTPVNVKQLVLKPNKAAIGRDFQKEAGRIMEELSKLDAFKVKTELTSQGFIEVAGRKLTSKHIELEEREEVVKGKKFIPHVIEPSYGADRLVYTVLEHAYSERDGRVVLKLPVKLAPIQVMVYPLVERDGLPEVSNQVYRELLEKGFRVEHDVSGSIGRRYARADEIGVPLGVTVDYQTLEDKTVTVRDRDSWRQRRIFISELANILKQFFEGRTSFEQIGYPVNANIE
ncbi:MAG: glycine--tRNA ligase [Candidatus Odinarchaeum yellowstonii]|uniref:glycine--tRNA ligase n=1 Tax=Odinarchaeota yellowstonii (strain LCB_4) TaxID=1841599 RepID=A0AAF0D1L0_ODILC|nr:MAG: glycine--tRNA ligase [Candidatus Odinarchaeum yellowstonii]